MFKTIALAAIVALGALLIFAASRPRPSSVSPNSLARAVKVAWLK